MGIDPLTMALMAGGAALSGFQKHQENRYNRKIARFNLEKQRQEAAYNASLAAEDTRMARAKNKRTLAKLRASYGASGLQLSGSPLDVIYDTAWQSSLEIARRRQKTQLMAYQSAVDLELTKSQERARRWQANYDIIGGVLQGATMGASLGGAFSKKPPEAAADAD